jgi:hypothetical protein
MRCTKCHKNEAIIHFTPAADGKAQKTVHLCKRCAVISFAPHTLVLKKPEILSLTGKRCEFCRRRARSGRMIAGRPVYFCSDCGKELGSIIVELCIAERPHLTERVEGTVTFILRDTPEVRAWLEAANLKAIEILRKRRRQDRRDKGS